MFATKNQTAGRTQLQQTLDRETVRTQSQGVGIDDNATSVFADHHADPVTPIFRRTTLRPKSFQADLFNERARA